MTSLTKKVIEKEFSTIPTIFHGKETESNWEARNACITRLRGFLQSNEMLLLKACFLTCLGSVINDVIKPIFSLRSTLALDGLDFVSELGNHLGQKLHPSTIETVIVGLVKCCCTSNKIIFNKATEVTNSFLQKVRFSTRIVVILCRTMDDKNNQVRQSAAEFLKTILTIHGPNFQDNSSASLQKYIKKGLTDASPGVRELCRQMYWIYYEHWPKEAEKICLEMDPGTLKQLNVSQKNTTASISRSNSFPIAPQNDATTKKSTLKRSSSALSHVKPLPRIPSVPMKSKKHLLQNSRLSNVSHISNMSAPAASIKHKLENRLATKVTRKTKSEFHEKQEIKKKRTEKEIPALSEELFEGEDDASVGSSSLNPADNLLLQEIDFSIYDGLSDFDPCTETTKENDEAVELSEKENTQGSPPKSPKPAQSPLESPEIDDKKKQTDNPTKITRKATEELRSEEVAKKRRVFEEPEEIEKAFVPGRTFNPKLEDLNQIARTNFEDVEKGIERMKAGDVDVSLLCDLQNLSQNTSLLDIYNVDANSNFWLYEYAEPFRHCIKEVVNLIQDEKTTTFVKYEAIHLASSLVHHQKALFLRFKKPIIDKQADYLYPFIRALSKAHKFPRAKKTIDDLLAIYPPDVSEILLKDTYEN